MSGTFEINDSTINKTVYKKGQVRGLYESYFLRANHPEKPLAFWIRYTVFSPDKKPEKAVGELWATWFDKETGNHVSVKEEVPAHQFCYSDDELKIRVGTAELGAGYLNGFAQTGDNSISWGLRFRGEQLPLYLFDRNLYKTRLPKAKSLVPLPNAVFYGEMIINGQTVEIDNWQGSQNHNWGPKHTDRYAWGQVAGFANYPETFFEVATAKLKFGPVWTPNMTVMVLRHDGVDYELNTIMKSLKAHGSFQFFEWEFFSENDRISIGGQIMASFEDFVCLKYNNPPGGYKHCLNSKIARCRLVLAYKDGSGRKEILETENRAAFEILTDNYSHGIPVSV